MLFFVYGVSAEAIDYEPYYFGDIVKEKLNWYRMAPVDYVVNNFESNPAAQDNLFKFFKISGNAGKAYLEKNDILHKTAEIRLYDMFEGEHVDNTTTNGLNVTTIAARQGFRGFVDEITVVLAFENFVPPERALDIMLNFAISKAMIDDEYYDALDKTYYDKLGSAFAGSRVELDGKEYNIYGLHLVLGW